MNALLAGVLVAAADPTAIAPVAPPPPSSQPPHSIYDVHLAIDVPVTVVAGSAGLVRVLFKEQLARKSCPCDPAGLNALDRGTVGNHSAAAGIAANVTVYGMMAALPLMDLADVGWGRAWGEDLLVYFETLAIDTALQNATNFIVARPRPRTYAGDPSYLASGEGYLSFYAGHVATAFASLSTAAFTLQMRHGQKVWPWIAAGLIASSVAFERVASGDHFPTDVAVAAVAGTAIGITVPWLHLRGGRIPISIAPIGERGLGIAGAF